MATYNVRNRVLTNLKTHINDDTIDYIVVRQQKITKDRTIYFEMLGDSEQMQTLKADTINGGLYSFQIETFSKNLNTCYEIMEKVISAMKVMCFDKGETIVLQNTQDINYMRLACRFTRLVGSNEEIKKITI